MQLQAAGRVRVLGPARVSRHRPCLCRAVSRPQMPTTAQRVPSEDGSRLAAALAATMLLSSALSPVAWADLEDSEVPASLTGIETAFKGINDGQKQKLSAADEAFQKSDTLKALLEKSEANKAKNKRDIQNKYCYRQAELGIGDCGGLRYIPGMTKSGKQKTPEWLQKVLGVEVPKVEGEGKTLADLLGPDVQP